MKDKDGMIMELGILSKVGPLIDPYYYPGTYVVVEVDEEKLSKSISPRNALNMAYINLSNKIDSMGSTKIRLKNERLILICTPGMKVPRKVSDWFLNGNMPVLNFKLVDEKIKSPNLVDQDGKIVASGITNNMSVIKDREGKSVIVEKQAFLNGDDVIDAKMRFERIGTYKVWIRFTEEGGKRFAEFTGNNIGKKYAIILDDTVYMSPVIESKFTGTEGIIVKGLPREEAHDLVLVLTAGNNIPVKIVDIKVKNPNNTWTLIKSEP